MNKIGNLPKWAFLDGDGPAGNTLQGRTIIVHIESGTYIEAFTKEKFLKDKTLAYNFTVNYENGKQESHILAFHFSVKFNPTEDRLRIINEVLQPCAEWYTKFLKWEVSI